MDRQEVSKGLRGMSTGKTVAFLWVRDTSDGWALGDQRGVEHEKQRVRKDPWLCVAERTK
jgi:hypothetical protein